LRTPDRSDSPRQPVPIRRVVLTLPGDVGAALAARSVREERPAKVEATRLLRQALERSGDLVSGR
jgi:hypothetical protein